MLLALVKMNVGSGLGPRRAQMGMGNLRITSRIDMRMRSHLDLSQ